MGTSVSQASPRTTSWQSVAACYQSDALSIDRTSTELWKAATSPTATLEAQIKSEAVFACFQLCQSKVTAERVHHALSEVSFRYGNSMIVEFAKRATLVATYTSKPAEHWPKQFFKEVAGYLVARDASGYLGPNCRSKTIGDLVSFRKAIVEKVAETVGHLGIKAKSSKEWPHAASIVLNTLTGVK